MIISSREIQTLSNKYGFHPSRSSGQNFLVSEEITKKIISAADIGATDVVLEIGPGFGALTTPLLERAARLVAVELDKRLAAAVRKLDLGSGKLEVIEGDIFQQWPFVATRLKDLEYKLVSNLPYNITSLVLRRFLEQSPRPSEMILTIQNEVAERVTARPGEMSVLSVAVRFYARPKILFTIGPENFWPQPEVNSALLQVSDIGKDYNGYQDALGEISVKKFFSLVRAGFAAKRKQLHHNIAALTSLQSEEIKKILQKIGQNPLCRAQELSVEEWIRLARLVIKN